MFPMLMHHIFFGEVFWKYIFKNIIPIFVFE